MIGKGLPIVEERVLSKKEALEEKSRARFEQKWRTCCYAPEATALGRERLKRTAAILSTLDLEGKKVADLGCGNAPFAAQLTSSHITALDVAEAALEHCPESVQTVRRYLPYTRLPEESFDAVLLTDVIADLEPHLYRLTLSEVAALMKREGIFLCSTELDLNSEDALDQFLALLQTEFKVVKLEKSYHRLYLHLRSLLDAPSRFVRASQEPDYRLRQMEKRRGVARLWFYCNSLKWVSYLWRLLAPLKKRLHSRSLLLFLERISETVLGEGALTHVIAVCARKGFQDCV